MPIAIVRVRAPVAARVLSLVCLLATAAGACAGINSQTNAFATLAEAREAGAIANGWVPDGLPPGTYELREAHVPDTTRRWGIFNFPQGEADTLRGLLATEELPLEARRVEAPARIEWWPLELRGDLSAARLAATGIRGYRAKSGGLVFAVNWKQGRAYYWAEP
jgi:hypothetical protein